MQEWRILANLAISCTMKIDGQDTRSIWLDNDKQSVGIIDQTLLPHRFAKARLASLADAAGAIKTMQAARCPPAE